MEAFCDNLGRGEIGVPLENKISTGVIRWTYFDVEIIIHQKN